MNAAGGDVASLDALFSDSNAGEAAATTANDDKGEPELIGKFDI